MNNPTEKLRLLEKILDQMQVAVTYVDTEGTVLYRNPIAAARPTKTAREIGTNIRDCHSEETSAKISHMFDEFTRGRREPHYYTAGYTGKREKVTIIPFFEGDAFVGCMSQIYTLDIEGPERSFP